MQRGYWPSDHRDWIGELPARLGPRKLRLLVGAWCRNMLEAELAKLPPDTSGLEHLKRTVRTSLETHDRFADTGKTKAALKEAVVQVDSLRETHGALFRGPDPGHC